MSYRQGLIHFSLLSVLALSVLSAGELRAGDYLISAHGASASGVARPAMTGYATGNCAHCHEMHASLAGSEPAPVGGAPSPYTLFATNFNTGAVPGNYAIADNVCFFCHSAAASVQAVVNADYSTTFGGGTAGTLPQYIMEAFNQASFHGLTDIQTFMTTGAGAAMAPWYTSFSNPCNACHNPHLAKRNYQDFTAPLSSAISKPSDHFSLWGESETMSSYSGYEVPYANAGTAAREPDGTVVVAGGDSSGQAAKTPDYVGFCTDCHTSTSAIPSTTLTTLRPINWLATGDKHGGRSRDGGLDIRNPYAAVAGTKSNFVLSCLDCHEPHGSRSIMLIRARANGENLETSVASTNDMGPLCKRCHKDDAAAVGGSANQWRYTHHDSSDAPYPGPPASCARCHNTTYGTAIPGSRPRIYCGFCHFHGSDDSWMDVVDSGLTTHRKTF